MSDQSPKFPILSNRHSSDEISNQKEKIDLDPLKFYAKIIHEKILQNLLENGSKHSFHALL